MRKARRGFLATSRDERVTVVPICFAHRGSTIYTAIDRKPKGRHIARLANIVSNPNVAVLVDRYSEDWRRLSYLLLHGDARLVEREKEAKKARELLTSKYHQYRRLKLGEAQVIAIRVREAKFWELRHA